MSGFGIPAKSHGAVTDVGGIATTFALYILNTSRVSTKLLHVKSSHVKVLHTGFKKVLDYAVPEFKILRSIFLYIIIWILLFYLLLFLNYI
jgi:hypothetical protein